MHIIIFIWHLISSLWWRVYWHEGGATCHSHETDQ